VKGDFKMDDKLILCEEGLHYTGVELLGDDSPFAGGVNFIQSYPNPMLGYTTEKVMIKKEDIAEVIQYLQNINDNIK